ncbi:MAG: hypothetical protein ACKV2Q_33710 [Planctomycetaceae bacterium]
MNAHISPQSKPKMLSLDKGRGILASEWLDRNRLPQNLVEKARARAKKVR